MAKESTLYPTMDDAEQTVFSEASTETHVPGDATLSHPRPSNTGTKAIAWFVLIALVVSLAATAVLARYVIVMRQELSKTIRKGEIRSGVIAGDRGNDDYTLFDVHDERVPRVFVTHVTFEPPFRTSPDVFVALRDITIDRGGPERIIVYTQQINPGGFNVEVHTWGNTQISMIHIGWIAYEGPPQQ